MCSSCAMYDQGEETILVLLYVVGDAFNVCLRGLCEDERVETKNRQNELLHVTEHVHVGSQEDTQTHRRLNISTPSVADVRSNNRSNIESSTSTPPAHIAVCAPIRLLSSSGQCASAAQHGNLKPSRTPRGIGSRADPDVPHTTLERIILKETDVRGCFRPRGKTPQLAECRSGMLPR